MNFSTVIILAISARSALELVGVVDPTFWSAVSMTLGVCLTFPLLKIAEALEGEQ